MTLPRPTPRPAPRPVPYPLEEKDTLREWVNAYAPEHLAVRTALQELPNDYYASCGYLRAHRPREAGPALTFWSAPLSKAHAINALLCREERTIIQVHTDCDLGRDKLYDYASNWGVVFSRIEGDATCTVQDAAGLTQGGRIITINRQTRKGTAKLDGYDLTVPVRYDPRSRLCFTSTLPTPETLLTYPVAALVLGLLPDTLRRVLPPSTYTADGVPLVWRQALHCLLPPERWYMPVTAALDEIRGACRSCAFWDSHAPGGCGVGQRDPVACPERRGL